MDDSKKVDVKIKKSNIDWIAFGLSGGVLLVFVIASIINMSALETFVNVTTQWAVAIFGGFWQLLVFVTFIAAIVLAFSKYGQVKLGKQKPDYGYVKWLSMIMVALLAGGSIFWSAAEPMAHFMNPAPGYTGVEGGTAEAVAPALSQAYLHWGYLAWAIFGTVGAVLLHYVHEYKGMPLAPRSMLYPILGEKGVYGPLGSATDAFSVLSVAAGTIGPLGFIAIQISHYLSTMFNIPDAYSTQVMIVVFGAIIHIIGALTSLEKGIIPTLSDFNIKLAMVLGAVVLIIGPGGFLLNNFMTAMGLYTTDFVRLSLFRAPNEWARYWTAFYWAWFIGYAPLMAVFVANISKGRTIRDMIIAVAVITPIVTNFWFSLLGGTGIFYELMNPGSVSTTINEVGSQAALVTIVQQLPFASILVPVFLVLVICFLMTTGMGMTYTMAMTVTGDDVPSNKLRIFYAIIMDVCVLILIKMGGVGALQSFIVLAAIPVSIVLVPMIWAGPKAAKEMYEMSELQTSDSTVLEEVEVSNL